MFKFNELPLEIQQKIVKECNQYIIENKLGKCKNKFSELNKFIKNNIISYKIKLEAIEVYINNSKEFELKFKSILS